MTPYLQQLILHGAIDSIEDAKWQSKDSVVSAYLRVRLGAQCCSCVPVSWSTLAATNTSRLPYAPIMIYAFLFTVLICPPPVT
jgi:hypothetical protein